MHGANEEERPESSDCWRIQAQEMPPFRKVVEASGQSSVYVVRNNAIGLSQEDPRSQKRDLGHPSVSNVQRWPQARYA